MKQSKSNVPPIKLVFVINPTVVRGSLTADPQSPPRFSPVMVSETVTSYTDRKYSDEGEKPTNDDDDDDDLYTGMPDDDDDDDDDEVLLVHLDAEETYFA